MNMSSQNPNHWKILVQLLIEVAKDRGINQDQIAEMTGMKSSSISRIFSLKFCPKLETYLAIAASLNITVFFEDTTGGLTDLDILFERAMTELERREERKQVRNFARTIDW